MSKKIAELSFATEPLDPGDVLIIEQEAIDKKVPLESIAKYVHRDSGYASKTILVPATYTADLDPACDQTLIPEDDTQPTAITLPVVTADMVPVIIRVVRISATHMTSVIIPGVGTEQLQLPGDTLQVMAVRLSGATYAWRVLTQAEEEARAHAALVGSNGVHGATDAITNNAIVRRRSDGRINGDITGNAATATNATNATTHAAQVFTENVHSATAEATPNRIVGRGPIGEAKFVYIEGARKLTDLKVFSTALTGDALASYYATLFVNIFGLVGYVSFVASGVIINTSTNKMMIISSLKFGALGGQGLRITGTVYPAAGAAATLCTFEEWEIIGSSAIYKGTIAV